MVANPFAAPSSSEKVITDENEGRLFLIQPLEIVENVSTVHGDTDALLADVYVLDEEGSNHEVYKSSMIFQKVLIGSLKRKIGTSMPVLGVLSKGPKQPGKNPPWVIKTDALTGDQISLAKKFWEEQNPFE